MFSLKYVFLSSSINRYIPVTWGLWVDQSLSHNSVDCLYHDTVNDSDKGDEDNEI